MKRKFYTNHSLFSLLPPFPSLPSLPPFPVVVNSISGHRERFCLLIDAPITFIIGYGRPLVRPSVHPSVGLQIAKLNENRKNRFGRAHRWTSLFLANGDPFPDFQLKGI